MVRERALVKRGMKGREQRRVEKGSRRRAGQYAQAGHWESYGNGMRSKEGSYGRPGRPGGERLAGGAKTVGGAIPFCMGLAFFRTLSGTFGSDPWRIFGKAFGGGRNDQRKRQKIQQVECCQETGTCIQGGYLRGRCLCRGCGVV